MNIVVADEGEVELMGFTLRRPGGDSSDWALHLYSNDYTPTRDVTLANLTELVQPGYTPAALDPAEWGEPETVAGQAVSWYGTGSVTLTVTSGAQFAYGFFVTNFAGTILLWVGRFDSPQFVTSGSPAVVPLSFAGRSQSEPS